MTSIARQPIRRTVTSLFVTAGVFVASLVLWARAAPAWPDRPTLPGRDEDSTLWIGDGKVPLTIIGSLEDADAIVLGDSRSSYGIDRFALAREADLRVAIAWYGGAELDLLLDAAENIEGPDLIVALSVNALTSQSNKLMLEVAREHAPVFDPVGATRLDVAHWVSAEAGHLEEEGFPAEYAEPLLARLQGNHARERAVHTRWTKRVDERLGLALAQRRFRDVYTVSTRNWHEHWAHEVNPASSTRVYRARLRNKWAARREAAALDVTERLRAAAATRRVVCIRLPIAPELREVEDGAMSPKRMAQIAEDAGVLYCDFGTSERTGDGSHLTAEGAMAFCGVLATWLRDEAAW